MYNIQYRAVLKDYSWNIYSSSISESIKLILQHLNPQGNRLYVKYLY